MLTTTTIKNHEKKGKEEIRRAVLDRMEARGLPRDFDVFMQLAAGGRDPLKSLWRNYKFADHPDTSERVREMSLEDYKRDLEAYLQDVERKLDRNPSAAAYTANSGAEPGEQLRLL